MIDSKYLALIKIAELGSYTKAASALALSQPAITMQIKQLESQLDVKLFERAKGRVNLTKEGEIVLKYANRMAAVENNLLQELKNEKERIRSLNVGITHSAESSAIIEALARFVSGIDRLNLKILTNTPDRLITMLKNYEIDFAFVEQPITSPQLRYATLGTDQLILAVAPEHPLAARESISLDELKSERLILRLPDSGTRSLFIASLESLNLNIKDFNVVIEIDSIATIKDLIRRSFGVSVLARSTCLDEARKGKLSLLSIEGLSMERSTNIVYRQDFEHPELIEGIAAVYHEMQA